MKCYNILYIDNFLLYNQNNIHIYYFDNILYYYIHYNEIDINVTFTKISAGSYHNLLLSNEKLYVFGKNNVK